MISDCGKKSARIKLEGVVKTGKPDVRLLELLVLLLYRNIWRRWCATSVVLVRGTGDRKKV